jgi:hypothetical protein
VTQTGLAQIKEVVPLVRNFKGKVPVGQWNWRRDADVAERYAKWITEGWPASRKDPHNPYEGKKFDASEAAAFMPELREAPEGLSRMLPLTAPASREQWPKRRAELLEVWQKIIGPMPDRVPLRPQVLSTETLPDYTRLLVRYQNDANSTNDAYVLLPKGVSSPGPGVVVLHQTSKTSFRDTVGLDGRESMHVALHLVRRGYVCVAPRNFLWNVEGKSYQQAAEAVLAQSPWKTGIAKMTFDAMRGVDLLLEQPNVDPQRVGAIGHSLGGKEALYLPAFDTRVKASVSCEGGVGISFSNWDAAWYLGPQVKSPDFKHDHHELMALIAPRALLVVGGESADGAKSWPYVAANLPLWKMLGAEDRLGLFRHTHGHDMPPDGPERERVYAWLDHWLK